MNAIKRISLAVLTLGAVLVAGSPAMAAATEADIHPDTIWTDSIQKQFRPTATSKLSHSEAAAIT